jgi:dTDP-L-oleandrosyltransferase
MSPRDVLFICVNGIGHVYPSLGVAAELVKLGHRVTYLTTPEFAGAVEEAGARVAYYKSEFDDVHLPDMARAEDAEAQVHLIYLRENAAILRAAEAACDDDPPDLVVYDVFPFIAGRLLARRWGVPAVRLSPIFAANEHYSIFDSLWRSAGYRHPAEVPRFTTAMTRLLSQYGVSTPIREFWDEIEGFNVSFIPRSFQIAAETFDERFAFVGPSFTEQRLRPTASWTPPADDAPVLLVSLGNMFNEHADFFSTCARAFADTPWHVVLAIGEFLDPAALGPLPPNVTAHSWIPFMEVLRRATVCMTHGTTGAIMESLYWGRPLAVVPHFAPEAAPSAARVAEMGLGYHLDPGQINERTLAATVQRLADDEDVLRRVLRIRDEIHEAGGAPRAAREIEAYLVRAARR